MPLWLLYLLIVLSVERVTWLLVADAIPLVKVPRDFLIAWLDPRDGEGTKTGEPPIGGFGRAIGYLLGCEWCTSVYVAAGMVWAVTEYTSVPLPVLVALSASMLTGMTADAMGWGNMRWRRDRSAAWLTEDDLRKRGLKIPNREG